ncbi:MAG: hypothetical protein K2V38_27050, partial [Gemmataceae bacterium]|nr:hypothetical protein [Gemmataceae bacterium]
MTAIGKLLAALVLLAGLVMMTWAVGVYLQRPVWTAKTAEGGEKPAEPVTFEQYKAEAEALNRAAAVASDLWGTNLKALEDREAFRADRLKAYAEREQWARTGNPKDLIEPLKKDSG